LLLPSNFATLIYQNTVKLLDSTNKHRESLVGMEETEMRDRDGTRFRQFWQPISARDLKSSLVVGEDEAVGPKHLESKDDFPERSRKLANQTSRLAARAW
jgi:hypothetical protein